MAGVTDCSQAEVFCSVPDLIEEFKLQVSLSLWDLYPDKYRRF